MRRATVRQLRHDFGSVLAWVQEGEAVEISKRGKIIALLSPHFGVRPAKRKKRPDLIARHKAIYGDKILSGNIVVEDRDSRSY